MKWPPRLRLKPRRCPPRGPSRLGAARRRSSPLSAAASACRSSSIARSRPPPFRHTGTTSAVAADASGPAAPRGPRLPARRESTRPPAGIGREAARPPPRPGSSAAWTPGCRHAASASTQSAAIAMLGAWVSRSISVCLLASDGGAGPSTARSEYLLKRQASPCKVMRRHVWRFSAGVISGQCCTSSKLRPQPLQRVVALAGGTDRDAGRIGRGVVPGLPGRVGRRREALFVRFVLVIEDHEGIDFGERAQLGRQRHPVRGGLFFPPEVDGGFDVGDVDSGHVRCGWGGDDSPPKIARDPGLCFNRGTKGSSSRSLQPIACENTAPVAANIGKPSLRSITSGLSGACSHGLPSKTFDSNLMRFGRSGL